MSRGRRSAARRALSWAMLALALLGAPARAGHGTTVRASLTTMGTQVTGSSAAPAISADGRYVAFASWAPDLVPGDTNGWVDIFVRELATGATERVSVSSAGVQANGPSLDATISADGRYVAFWSAAGNLADHPPGPPFSHTGAFVHDRLTGTTVRASVTATGETMLGYVPSISGDGRFVAFWTGRVLSPDRFEIGVRDLVAGQTSIVRADSTWLYEDPVGRPVLSADGRYVAFVSDSPNLVPGDSNGVQDVFVHDRITGLTERVSVSSSERQDPTGPSSPSISADGRYVAFSGSRYLDESEAQRAGIFIRDRIMGTTTLVSVHTTGEPMGQAGSPAISADGRRVAFHSSSTEESRQAWPVRSRLPEGTDSNVFQALAYHVYVKDLITGETHLASVSSGGQRGDASSRAPSLSADGRLVVFQSWATNLVPDDTNDAQDIFVHDSSPGPPTCADGGYEEGLVSGQVHERIEPAAGPAAQPVHDASCALLVPRGL